MHFQRRILDDLHKTLQDAVNALKTGHFDILKQYSQQTIHNASVFQDNLSIDVAVILYALYKVLQTKRYLARKFEREFYEVMNLLYRAPEQAEKKLRLILDQLLAIDEKTKQAVADVIDQARLKKGSSLYNHGISLSQAAKRMGISQWELYNYIGKMEFSERDKESVAHMRKRLSYARKLLTNPDVYLGMDAGAIITLTANNLLWVLADLHTKKGIKLVIPKGVYTELVTQPLQTRRHKLEAFHVIKYINSGVVQTIDSSAIRLRAQELMKMCNHIFYAWGHPIHIVDQGEMETIAMLQQLQRKTLVMDERTTRFLLESPQKVASLLERRLHTRIHVDSVQLAKIADAFKGIQVIRTAELVTALFEQGFFSDMVDQTDGKIDQPVENLLEGLLWGLKLNGCAITQAEIYSIVKQCKSDGACALPAPRAQRI